MISGGMGLGDARDLLGMIRVPILVGGVAGCVLGALLGLQEGGAFTLGRFALCYLAVGLADLSTHFSNSFYDVESDRFAESKTFGKENPLIKKELLQPKVLRIAGLLSILSLVSASLAIIYGVSWTIFILALSYNILGWLYSGPPFRLVSRGVGESAIALATGLIVPGAGYLATQVGLGIRFLEYAAPLMLLGFVLSLSLELPDIVADDRGGKRNVAVRLGWRNTLRLAFLLAVFSNVFFYVFYGLLPWLVSLISSIVLLAGNVYGNSDHGRLDAISTASVSSLFLSLIAIIIVLIYA
jgi:1,4-dihydroxy-2-naphthoate polyprenyltransferase